MTLMLDRRFAPFFWTQFLGAFTDNAFKQALILMITFRATMTEAETGMLIAIASGLFILPFFLFSPLAGQISDKFEKASVMRNVKLLEIAIMLLAAIGFTMAGAGVSWADSFLIGILFLMGTQSTFFGPVKYSIIPQHIRADELMEGTALVESGTFVAILVGTIVGGVLIMQSVHLVGASLIALAVAGWLSSRKIPFAAPSNPNLKIRWNWFHEYKNLYRVSNQKPSVFLSIIGISWFWFLGAMVMAQLPNFVKLFVRGDESVYILFLSLFTLSIAIGSVLTDVLSDTSIELGMVPLGVLGLSIFSFDIGLLDYSNLPEKTTTIASVLTGGADRLIYRVIFDVCGMGVAGSFFIVPLYALLQHRTASETRSQVIAANNVAGAIFMVASAAMVSVLYAIGFDTAQLFLVLAGLNAVVGAYLLTKHPEFVLRLGIWLVATTRYRVRYIGRHQIPRDGACLLYANRIGWLDWPLVTAACERPIRFVFETDQRSGPTALVLRKWFGAIALDPEHEGERVEGAADEIHRALLAGELVCLFGRRARENLAVCAPLVAELEPVLRRTCVPGIPLVLQKARGGIQVAIGEAQPEVSSPEALAAAHELLATS